MTTLLGRRLPDLSRDQIHSDVRAGDYWRALNSDGTPVVSNAQGNLTHGVWYVAAPVGDAEGYAIGRLENHTVREEDDGTISVRPNDGSSNSILLTRGDRSFHGYIEHGVWSSV